MHQMKYCLFENQQSPVYVVIGTFKDVLTDVKSVAQFIPLHLPQVRYFLDGNTSFAGISYLC